MILIFLFSVLCNGFSNRKLLSGGAGICSIDKTISCSTNSDCVTGICYLPIIGGITLSNQICMQTAAGQNLQCTANDVKIASTSSLEIIDDCSRPGDDAIVSFVAKFELTSQDRYDIGVWIAEDGKDALVGYCSVSNFPTAPSLPWTSLDTIQDTCGDITSTNNPLYSSIRNIKVKCNDVNNDENLDISVCLSWQQPGSNEICTSPIQAFPGSPSKCLCQTLPGIKVRVPPIMIVQKVTEVATNNNFNFILTNTLGFQLPFTLNNGELFQIIFLNHTLIMFLVQVHQFK